MFVDSDVILTPHCISTLFSELKKLGWAGIHARVLSAKNDTYWQRAEDARIQLHFNRIGPRNAIGTGAALFDRRILLACPFDTNFLESGEDMDFFFRLSRAGQKFGVSYPVVYHEHRREFREFVRQRLRAGRGLSRLAVKYRSTSILFAPLSTMISGSLRDALQGRIWLVPYWIVEGTCCFTGAILGLRNAQSSMTNGK
jgi:hypothetical protein